MEKNIFELAAKHKFRYNFRGEITTEDLFDLSVNDLDSIYKNLKKEQEKSGETGLLVTQSKEDAICATKMEIVQYIFSQKQQEKADQKAKAEKKLQRQKILQTLYEKQESEMKSKSAAELMDMLKELDDEEV
ncbi:MAG: hypothetical protein J6S14_15400 [Clostridia bacterium]|nr:hypothetical protein [Clostridia bacterium]